MHHYLATSFFLSILLLSPSTPHCWGQTPAPRTMTQFALPLADNTTATAAFLPTTGGSTYLVYGTPTGRLGFFLLTAPTDPTPPNPWPPIPPTPPVPPAPPVPIPQKLTIAIVEDPATTTQQQRSILADPAWRRHAADKHHFRGIIPTDLIEKGTNKPPASLAPFLDAAKGRMLPWILLVAPDGTILFQGPLPPTTAELTATIRRYGG